MIKAGIAGLGWWGKTLVEGVADSKDIRFVAGSARNHTDDIKAFSKQYDFELYNQVGFTTALGLKDTGLMLAAGLAANVPLPSLNVYRDKLLAAMANGDENCDWAVMARHQARAAGLDK